MASNLFSCNVFLIGIHVVCPDVKKIEAFEPHIQNVSMNFKVLHTDFIIIIL